ncbi:hypothetical protein GCM10009839_46300 [Catenulispora yoronensis]|uniref:Uncharacterized protein n=1 Tax=Catenulispora yoronensis TaxID=450799 RepID=A0ABP5G4N4_9ACTN
MTTDTAWPDPAPGAPDPAALIAELTDAGWECRGFDWTSGTKAEYLDSPSGTLALEVETGSGGGARTSPGVTTLGFPTTRTSRDT